MISVCNQTRIPMLYITSQKGFTKSGNRIKTILLFYHSTIPNFPNHSTFLHKSINSHLFKLVFLLPFLFHARLSQFTERSPSEVVIISIVGIHLHHNLNSTLQPVSKCRLLTASSIAAGIIAYQLFDSIINR